MFLSLGKSRFKHEKADHLLDAAFASLHNKQVSNEHFQGPVGAVRHNKSEFWHRLTTTDSIDHYIPETKTYQEQ